MTRTWDDETGAGQRFGFGANWRGYLARLDEGRIRQAEASVAALLGQRDLSGLRLLDLGSGSGLFSLAARRLAEALRARHAADLGHAVTVAQSANRVVVALVA